jgi:U3 small nucleolar RNA-associated protein 13
MKTLEGHTNSVLRVEFLTLGTQLLSVGSDGLSKLWTIKSGECVSTQDTHDDKAWALAVRERWSAPDAAGNIHEEEPCLIATGGADARIVLYEDGTKEELARQEQDRERRLVAEQDLSNFLMRKDYRSAIVLAMKLNQPGRLASIFMDLLNGAGIVSDPTLPFGGEHGIEDILARMNDAQLEQLLGYIRDWNTNAKFARVAQTVLHVLLRRVAPERLLQLATIKEVLDALLPYSERHYARVDALLTNSWLVEYTLDQMEGLIGLDD